MAENIAKKQNDHGVLYLAARSYKYVLDASLSALSCRRIGYRGPITLYSNLNFQADCPQSLITHVAPISTPSSFKSGWVTGKFPKLEALKNSPYNTTLYLDTDTRIQSSAFSDYPAMMGENDIAMVQMGAKDSFCARALNAELYNAGIILYKNTVAVQSLFKDWQQLTQQHHSLLSNKAAPLPTLLDSVTRPDHKKRLLGMDQLGLYMLLNPHTSYPNIQAAALNNEWNNRDHTFEHCEGAIIHHTNVYRKRLDHDTALAISSAQESGDKDLANWLTSLWLSWHSESP